MERGILEAIKRRILEPAREKVLNPEDASQVQKPLLYHRSEIWIDTGILDSSSAGVAMSTRRQQDL